MCFHNFLPTTDIVQKATGEVQEIDIKDLTEKKLTKVCCFFDNIFLEDKALFIPINRAFEYGDGFFETIIVQNNEVLYFSDHFLRIQAASKALFLQLPADFSEDFVRKVILKLIDNNSNDYSPTFRIKITFWRKNGGFYTPTFPQNECNTHILIRVVPYETKNISGNILHQNPLLKVSFSDKIKLSFSSFSSYKTLNSLPYVLAGIEKTERNLDDMVLLDTQNNISECSSANIFWIKNDKIFTPNLQTGCVGGIMRKQVIQTAHKLLIDLEEGFFPKTHLIEADCVFTTNVTGIRWIENIENQQFSKHKMLEVIAETI